jgi:hypothetical protein
VRTASRDDLGGIVGDEHFAGMKGAVNQAGVVRGVEAAGHRTETRDQIVDRRRAEVAESGFKGNTAGFG